MTERFSKILCDIQFHLLTFSIVDQEPSIKLRVKLQVSGWKEGGVSGDCRATVQGDKDVLVKDVSEDIVAVVDRVMEKLVDSSQLRVL